jgi:hypothetical protein
MLAYKLIKIYLPKLYYTFEDEAEHHCRVSVPFSTLNQFSSKDTVKPYLLSPPATYTSLAGNQHMIKCGNSELLNGMQSGNKLHHKVINEKYAKLEPQW